MGFFDRIVSGAKSLGRTVGNFTTKVSDGVGKFGGVVRKVGEALKSDTATNIFDGLNQIPFIGTVSSEVQRLADPLITGGRLIERGSGIAGGFGNILSTGNTSEFGHLVGDTKGLVGDVKSFVGSIKR